RRFDHRQDLLLEILTVDTIDLGRHLERYAAMLRNADGAIDAFFGRDAAKKCEVGRLDRLWLKQVFGQSVMDGAHPIGLRQGPSLRVGNRHDRYRRESIEDRLMFG